jgi:hypothetical protein
MIPLARRRAVRAARRRLAQPRRSGWPAARGEAPQRPAAGASTTGSAPTGPSVKARRLDATRRPCGPTAYADVRDGVLSTVRCSGSSSPPARRAVWHSSVGCTACWRGKRGPPLPRHAPRSGQVQARGRIRPPGPVRGGPVRTALVCNFPAEGLRQLLLPGGDDLLPSSGTSAPVRGQPALPRLRGHRDRVGLRRGTEPDVRGWAWDARRRCAITHRRGDPLRARGRRAEEYGRASRLGADVLCRAEPRCTSASQISIPSGSWWAQTGCCPSRTSPRRFLASFGHLNGYSASTTPCGRWLSPGPLQPLRGQPDGPLSRDRLPESILEPGGRATPPIWSARSWGGPGFGPGGGSTAEGAAWSHGRRRTGHELAAPRHFLP